MKMQPKKEIEPWSCSLCRWTVQNSSIHMEKTCKVVHMNTLSTTPKPTGLELRQPQKHPVGKGM